MKIWFELRIGVQIGEHERDIVLRGKRRREMSRSVYVACEDEERVRGSTEGEH